MTALERELCGSEEVELPSLLESSKNWEVAIGSTIPKSPFGNCWYQHVSTIKISVFYCCFTNISNIFSCYVEKSEALTLQDSSVDLRLCLRLVCDLVVWGHKKTSKSVREFHTFPHSTLFFTLCLNSPSCTIAEDPFMTEIHEQCSESLWENFIVLFLLGFHGIPGTDYDHLHINLPSGKLT